MPALEIKYPSGATESVQLSKEMPVSIGRHPTNDIHIDDESIAPLHCRISWQDSGYRVNTAGDAKIRVNGKEVIKSRLNPGDVIDVGTAKIAMVDEATPRRDDRAQAEINEFDLKPLDDEEELEGSQSRPPASQEEPQPPTERATPKKKPRKQSRKPKKPALPSESIAELDLGDIIDSSDGLSAVTDMTFEQDKPKSKQDKSKKTPLTGKAVRPGERDAVRSPFVLILTGAGVLILLLAATFAFMNQRQAVKEQFDTAMDSKQKGQYGQAIQKFQEFLVNYPRHDLTNQAKVMLGLASIEQHISGSGTAWERGLKATREFRKNNQDLPEFKEADVATELQGYVSKIALGAARGAKGTLNPELLTISAEASSLLGRIAVDEKAKDLQLEKVAAVVKEAKAAILKRKTFDEQVAEIEKAIEAVKPIDALKSRRALLDRYADFRADKKVAKLLALALTTEQELVKRNAEAKAALTKDRPRDVATVLPLGRHTRARSGDRSVGESVIVLSEDCCYCIDTITGMPLWRRVVGFDTPFFPIELTVAAPALLAFNTHDNELQLIAKKDGKLLWRIDVAGRASGKPVVHEGQIFLPTSAGRLCQIDLETGELTSQLSFSQPLASAPAISDSGKHLFVAGHQGVMYLLSRRPLACVQVHDSGHAPGTIEAPLLAMGPYLLAVENDRRESCRLRLYDIAESEPGIKEIASQRVDGHVRDYPVLRGNRLFVPSSGERIAAFTLTEEKGQAPLSRVASYQNESPIGCPIYLTTGPDDHLWMAARDLRKFQLTLDALEPDEKRMQVGLCSQPLQVVRNALFIAGRRASSRTVFFQGTDRQEMAGKWQLVLGSPLLATTSSGTDGLVCVTAAGDLFRITEAQTTAGGFQFQPSAQLRVRDEVETAYRATRIHDGRIAVSSSGKQPHLWLINTDGGIDQDVDLEASPQTAPVTVAGALLLGLPGKLHFSGKTLAGGTVQDFLAPVTGEAAVPWKQLASLDEDQALVLTAAGKLSRLQLRSQQVPFLEEVASVDLEQAVDVAMISSGDRLILADAKPSLKLLNGRSLEILSAVDLPLPAAQPPWRVGQNIYVQCGRDQLLCFGLEKQLSKVWQSSLPKTSVAGQPLLHDGALIVALQNGQVRRLDPKTGKSLGASDTGQALTDGPFLLGKTLVVVSADGSLLSLKPKTTEAGQ